ncbi:hypothetical protein EG327_010492 [Venturia inaequalis]|uniref:Uncharacterized protein n=1 Tax=Venturia inaequalis TaxID=5025 RepID=A0A8H3UI16_VENIN|nr:hypothetical protein EG327_010492 [Venturia inaequalis]
MDNSGQGNANNVYRGGGFHARGGQRGGVHQGPSRGNRGGYRGGYRQRGGLHNGTHGYGAPYNNIGTSYTGAPHNVVPFNDSAFWNHINTTALNIGRVLNGGGHPGGIPAYAPVGTIQAGPGGWNGGGNRGRGQSYANAGTIPAGRGGGFNVGRGDFFQSNKRNAYWDSMDNDAKKVKLDHDLDYIQHRATKKETETAAQKMELDRELDGIREKAARKEPVTFFSLPREVRQQIIRDAYEDTVPAAVPTDLSTDIGRLHFRYWHERWFACHKASAPLTLTLAKVDDRMVNDVNFIMVKCALKRRALQTEWIERCKEAFANRRFACLQISKSFLWRDACSAFWTEGASVRLWEPTDGFRERDLSEEKDHNADGLFSDT